MRAGFAGATWFRAPDILARVAELPDVTDATFETEVLNAGRPVVVDFWAPWCGPCRAIAPIMQELAVAHGERVGFVKLNVDENPVTAGRFGVLSIPTVILFQGGEPQETVVGARPRKHFEQVWAAWLDGTGGTGPAPTSERSGAA